MQAVITCQASQTVLVAAANRIEFPFCAVTVQFADNYTCFNGEIFTQVKADQLFTIRIVDDTHIRTGDLSEVLASAFCIIDGNQNAILSTSAGIFCRST